MASDTVSETCALSTYLSSVAAMPLTRSYMLLHAAAVAFVWSCHVALGDVRMASSLFVLAGARARRRCRNEY